MKINKTNKIIEAWTTQQENKNNMKIYPLAGIIVSTTLLIFIFVFLLYKRG